MALRPARISADGSGTPVVGGTVVTSALAITRLSPPNTPGKPNPFELGVDKAPVIYELKPGSSVGFDPPKGVGSALFVSAPIR
jgi:hypothetical protein